MWEFIKYCLICSLIIPAGMFGDPLPEWVSFIDVIVGGITLFVLMGLAFGILWLIRIIVEKVRKNKK